MLMLQNYLVESTSLFDLLINYQLFENKEVLLFLNKKDLLREKIVNSHLADYFPDYIGEILLIISFFFSL